MFRYLLVGFYWVGISSFFLIVTEQNQRHSKVSFSLCLPRVTYALLTFRFRQRHSALRAFKRRSSGFTLIELLAAVVVLSVVSVLAVQALNISIFQQNTITRMDNENMRLARALKLIRQDLQAALPMPFHPAYETSKDAFVASNDKQEFEFSISGHPGFPGESGVGFARVSWKLDSATGRLYRKVIPTLYPSSSNSVDYQLEILSGIEDLFIETIFDDISNEQHDMQLPRAFIVTLVTIKHGIVSLQVAR